MTSTIKNLPSIVEQGTSGIYTYRKWSDGTAECWGTYSKNVSINANANVAMYPPNYPSIFVGYPCVVVSGGGNVAPTVFPTYCRAVSGMFDTYMRNVGTTAFNGEAWVYIYAIGKWK